MKPRHYCGPYCQPIDDTHTMEIYTNPEMTEETIREMLPIHHADVKRVIRVSKEADMKKPPGCITICGNEDEPADQGWLVVFEINQQEASE